MTIKPDYSQIQTEAARRILIEVMNILEEYKEDMRVVGGWVPDLYYPERYHVRSIDVDVLLNHVTLAEKDPGYLTIDRILKKWIYQRFKVILQVYKNYIYQRDGISCRS